MIPYLNGDAIINLASRNPRAGGFRNLIALNPGGLDFTLRHPIDRNTMGMSTGAITTPTPPATVTATSPPAPAPSGNDATVTVTIPTIGGSWTTEQVPASTVAQPPSTVSAVASALSGIGSGVADFISQHGLLLAAGAAILLMTGGHHSRSHRRHSANES